MDRTNGNSFAARLRRYTIHGWLRHIRLRLFGKRVVVAGSCNLCGRCCRRISLEAGGRWLRSEKEFLRLVSRYPEYSRFSLISKDAQGFLLFTCDWYDEESRICRDHDERLEICRNYPDIDLYFTGGAIHEGCGYRFSEVVPFAKILNQELQARHGPNKAQKSAGD